MCLVSVSASADTFIFDEFQDGDVTTNTSGIGDGFEAAVRNEGSIVEEDDLVKILGGNTGASRNQIGSNNSFSANGSPVFGIFSVTDMYRRDSADGGTARFYAGFCPTLPNFQGPVENAVDGLWIVIHSRYNLAGIDTWSTGDGGLVYIDDGVRTVLARWAWDSSVFTFDTASGFRSDRVAVDMIASDLTFVLSSDSDGYSLSISSTDGSVILPDAVSGSWADAGVTNDLSEVYASVWTQGSNSGNEMGLFLDRIVVNEEGWTGGAEFPLARSPAPKDGTMLEASWANLSWRAGDFAVSHDLYFGTSFDDVNDGAEGICAGNLAGTTQVVGFFGFPAPEGLQPGTTYYWRVDEVNDANAASPWKGNVWSFWIPPRTAYNSTPVDGAVNVLDDVTLGWTAGLGAQLHQIYFGDNFDDVSNASGAVLSDATTYAPDALEAGKTYYWRVDEFSNGVTHKGDIWSLTMAPDVPAQDDDPNLVGWWKLDEGQYSTALDLSGNNRHGVFQGDPQWTDGYELTALEFDGSDDYVNINDYKGITADATNPGNPVQRPFTVACWIKTTGNGEMVTWGSSPGGQRLSFRIDGGTLRTEHGNGNLRGNTPVSDGRWHHVALVVNEGAALWTPQTLLYLYGVADSTFSGSDSTYNLTEGEDVSIGRRATSDDRFFPGSIDDIRIYDKALTAEEIQQLMVGDLKLAGKPVPDRVALVDIRDISSLSWSAGDTAASHDVYFGTDRDAVAGADNAAPEFQCNQTGTSLSLAGLAEFGGGDYYWRVDEVAADGTVTAGTVWKFTVPDRLIVDDFESYNDINEGEEGSNRIYLTWIDGFDN
ncbi:MAG: LamG domain-containing protein, partial [Planctomycetota bacterium]